MRRLFGTHKPVHQSDQQQAPSRSYVNQSLNIFGELIFTTTQRIDNLKTKVREQGQTARDCIRSGDKRGALRFLKRKKLYEEQVQRMEIYLAELRNYDYSIAAIEHASDSFNTISVSNRNDDDEDDYSRHDFDFRDIDPDVIKALAETSSIVAERGIEEELEALLNQLGIDEPTREVPVEQNDKKVVYDRPFVNEEDSSRKEDVSL